jgi:hypothetical protein
MLQTFEFSQLLPGPLQRQILSIEIAMQVCLVPQSFHNEVRPVRPRLFVVHVVLLQCEFGCSYEQLPSCCAFLWVLLCVFNRCRWN